MSLEDLITHMEDIKSEVEIDTDQDLIALVTKMVGRTNEVRLWIYSETIKNKKNSISGMTKINHIIKEIVINRIEYIIESSNVFACSIGYQEYRGGSISYVQTIDDLKSSISKDWVQFFIILKIPNISNWKSFSDH